MSTPINTTQTPISHHQIMALLHQLLGSLNAMEIENNSQIAVELERYLQLTNGEVGWMRLQSGAVLVCGIIGGAASLAVAFYPKNAEYTLPDSLTEKLLNANFQRGILKTAGTVVPQLGQGVQMVCQGPITNKQALKAMSERVHLADAQQNRSRIQQLEDILDRTVREMVGKNRLRG